jgi:hypothetical protein
MNDNQVSPLEADGRLVGQYIFWILWNTIFITVSTRASW